MGTAAMPQPHARPPHADAWRSLLTALGGTGPACPCCGHDFGVMPKRRRTCPACGQVIYSRKRALDGVKVLLTEAQARDGEGQAALAELAREGADAALSALVATLRAREGEVPSAEQVVAAYLESAATAQAHLHNWGLFRNARFRLAESCARQGRTAAALRLLLEVTILDLNGAHNCGTRNPEVLRRFPPFDPRLAFIAPGIVRRTAAAASKLGLSVDGIRAVFDDVVRVVSPDLGLPRAGESMWGVLERALAFDRPADDE